MDTLCLWAIPLEPGKINGEVVVIMGLFSEGCMNFLPCSDTFLAFEPKARVWLEAVPFGLAWGWRCAQWACVPCACQMPP